MSFQQQPPRRRSGGGAIALLILVLGGVFIYFLYTDEITGAIATTGVEGVISGFEDLLPLSLANASVDGDTICDLDLSIPTTVNNRSFFGTTSGDVISQGEGMPKQSQMVIADFLNEPQWYYIGLPEMEPPTFEWKNCYIEGEGGIASLIPIFNGQIASEKLSLLSISESTREFATLDPSAASLGPFTESTSISLAISGKNSDGLFMIDKNNKGNFARSVQVNDGIAYPITDILRFTVENTKLDDYKISVISVKPINEMIIGEPYVFDITG